MGLGRETDWAAVPEPRSTVERLMRVEEVADWLAFKASTIRAYCEKGKIPHLRIGGQLRFRREELAAWIEQHAGRVRRGEKRC